MLNDATLFVHSIVMVRQSVAVRIHGIAFVVRSVLFTLALARNIWQGMCAVSLYVNVKQTISTRCPRCTTDRVFGYVFIPQTAAISYYDTAIMHNK